jgi:hypothetical protein
VAEQYLLKSDALCSGRSSHDVSEEHTNSICRAGE